MPPTQRAADESDDALPSLGEARAVILAEHRRWRESFLKLIGVITTITGLFATYFVLRSPLAGVARLAWIVFVSVLVASMLSRLPYRVKAIGAIAAMVGLPLSGIWAAGFGPNGFAILSIAITSATILLGRRAGTITLLVATIGLAAIALAHIVGAKALDPRWTTAHDMRIPAVATRIVGTLVGLGFVLVMGIGRVLDHADRSFADKALALEALKAEAARRERVQLALDVQVERLRAIARCALDSSSLPSPHAIQRRAADVLAEAFFLEWYGCVALSAAPLGLEIRGEPVGASGEGCAITPLDAETYAWLASLATPSVFAWTAPDDHPHAAAVLRALAPAATGAARLAWIPLAGRSEALVAISVGDLPEAARDRALESEHVPFLELLATHVDRACENATLRERLREHGERLERRVEERTAELTLANAELARASRLKDDFLASMSHELRTPLNAVVGFSDALLEGVYGDLAERQARTVMMVQDSGLHLLALINDILDVAKIGAGKLDLQIDVIDPRDTALSAASLVRAEAQKKHIQLDVEVPTDLPRVEADARRLKQIFVNLLSNAVKFTGDGGRVTFAAHAEDDGQHIYFAVSDTGIGIAEQDIARLFSPFVQLSSGLDRAHEGTGLGLALVRALAELHGGHIAVASTLGHGSRFSLTLPTRHPAIDPRVQPSIPFEGRLPLELPGGSADST